MDARLMKKTTEQDELPPFNEIWEPIETLQIDDELEDARIWVKNLIESMNKEEKIKITA